MNLHRSPREAGPDHRKHSRITPERTGLLSVGWLFVIHALANLMVGTYRCHDLEPHLTDVLAAALPRAQICLLTLWLFAGRERLSWRICGMIAGSCFVFTVFSRLLFPGRPDIGPGSIWLDIQWAYCFRPSGPGDLLVKSPVLILGIGLPLVIGRLGSGLYKRFRSPTDPTRFWTRGLLQFGYQDLAVWFAAVCLVLATLYQTPAHPGWFASLFERVRDTWRLEEATDRYSVASAAMYVWLAWVAIGLVFSKLRWPLRMAIAVPLVIVPAGIFDGWLQDIAQRHATDLFAPIWFHTLAETATAIVATAAIAGSLGLVRLFSAKGTAAH